MIETGFVPASGFLICFTFADTARITNGIATMDMGAVGRSRQLSSRTRPSSREAQVINRSGLHPFPKFVLSNIVYHLTHFVVLHFRYPSGLPPHPYSSHYLPPNYYGLPNGAVPGLPPPSSVYRSDPRGYPVMPRDYPADYRRSDYERRTQT